MGETLAGAAARPLLCCGAALLVCATVLVLVQAELGSLQGTAVVFIDDQVAVIVIVRTAVFVFEAVAVFGQLPDGSLDATAGEARHHKLVYLAQRAAKGGENT